MEWSPPEGEIAETVAEVLAAHDARLVDISVRPVKTKTHVVVVAFQRGGIGLDTLTEVHRLLRPRLESMLGDDRLHVEFSSPGITRTMKSFHEFAIFIGSDVTVYLGDGTSVDGKITEADDSIAVIQTLEGEITRVAPDQITKARLRE